MRPAAISDSKKIQDPSGEEGHPYEFEIIACDYCGSEDRASIYTGPDWQGQPVPDRCALVRCNECGLIYLSPRPTPATIGFYYPTDYVPYRPAVEAEPNPLLRWTRRRKLTQRRRWVEKITGLSTGRILDVGCSTGLFLNEMKAAGWETAGVELSSWAAGYARETFALDVITGMLPDVADLFAPASFDVITYWDVLEHTFSPSVELQHCARLLRPDGILAINIPNWESPDRKIFGPFWIGLDPPRHLFVFPRRNLRAYFDKFGYQEIGSRGVMSGYFSFIISIDRWLEARAPAWKKPVTRLLNFPGVRFIFEPYFALANWASKGGIITIFARKK